MPPRRALAIGLAVTAALVGVHVAWRIARPESMDDAYMFVRYAKEFLAGHGHAWNPDGQQVFGLTGSLHFLLVLALVALLPLSDDRIVTTASLVWGVLAFAALARVAVSLASGRLRQESPWLVGGLALALLPQTLFITQALNGMDALASFLTNALVAGAALRLTRRADARALVASVAAGWLAVFARPDNGLYAVGVPALAILLAGPAPRLRTAAKFLVGIGLVLALDAGVKTLVFGDPLPLSFYAKRSGYYAGYAAAHLWNPFEYLGLVLAALLPFLLVIAIGANRRTAPRLVALLAPVGLTFAFYFSVVQIMGGGARYYVPSFPFVILAAVIVLDDLVAAPDGWREAAQGLRTRWPLALLLAIAAPTALYDAERVFGRARALPVTGLPASCFERAASGRLPDVDYFAVIDGLAALARALPPGTRIALSEHGRIGAAAPQVLLDDLIALHDPQFAHHGFDAEVELDRRPDAIWLPHVYYTRMWRELATSPRLWRDYDVWPDALLYGFAIRRDAPQREQILAGYRALWSKLYPGLDPEAWRATGLRADPSCASVARSPLPPAAP